jgi:hypothetical protein
MISEPIAIGDHRLPTAFCLLRLTRPLRRRLPEAMSRIQTEFIQAQTQRVIAQSQDAVALAVKEGTEAFAISVAFADPINH